MKKQYTQFKFAMILFDNNDIMTVSGDGDNFGATPDGWITVTDKSIDVEDK